MTTACGMTATKPALRQSRHVAGVDLTSWFEAIFIGTCLIGPLGPWVYFNRKLLPAFVNTLQLPQSNAGNHLLLHRTAGETPSAFEARGQSLAMPR